MPAMATARRCANCCRDGDCSGCRFFRGSSHGDGFYEHLIDAHKGLSDEQSEALNARLIFLLANHM